MIAYYLPVAAARSQSHPFVQEQRLRRAGQWIACTKGKGSLLYLEGFDESSCKTQELSDGVIFYYPEVLPHFNSLCKKKAGAEDLHLDCGITLQIVPAVREPRALIFGMSPEEDGIADHGITKYARLSFELWDQIKSLQDRGQDEIDLNDPKLRELVYEAIAYNYAVTPHLLNQYQVLNEDDLLPIAFRSMGVHYQDPKCEGTEK